MPLAPFRVLRSDEDADALDVEHESDAGPRFARLIPDGSNGYTSKLDADTPSLREALEVGPGPAAAEWRIATSVFTCLWPAGFAVCSNQFPRDPGPFDLIGADGETLWVWTPRTAPPLEELRAPYQRLHASGSVGDVRWAEFVYEHEGETWIQRHCETHALGARAFVSVQALAASADAARQAALDVARSLEAAGPEAR